MNGLGATMNGLGATVMLAWGDSGVVLLELILLACSFHSVMFFLTVCRFTSNHQQLHRCVSESIATLHM